MTISESTTRPSAIKAVSLHPHGPVLDAQGHPEILKQIIYFCPHPAKLSFRLTSRIAQAVTDHQLFAHVVINQWGELSFPDRPPSPLFALVTPTGHKLPCKPMVASNKAWERRLAPTRILDSTVRTPFFHWEAIVRAAQPRVLRRLVSDGLWRASHNLTVVDLLVLSPRSLDSKLGQDMMTATLMNRPGKHVINVLFDPSFCGAYFPIGSGGDKHKGHAVLIFNTLPRGRALRRHLYHPVDDAPVKERNLNLTSLEETFFDSLAQIVMSGVYVDYTFVGPHEVDHVLLGVNHKLEPEMIKAHILNLIRERQHRDATLGLPPLIGASELAAALTMMSHEDYRRKVGPEQYKIETWAHAPAPWWSASDKE